MPGEQTAGEPPCQKHLFYQQARRITCGARRGYPQYPRDHQEPGQLSTEDPYENVKKQPGVHGWDIPQPSIQILFGDDTDEEAEEEYRATVQAYNDRLRLAGIKRKRDT